MKRQRQIMLDMQLVKQSNKGDSAQGSSKVTNTCKQIQLRRGNNLPASFFGSFPYTYSPVSFFAIMPTMDKMHVVVNRDRTFIFIY